MNSVGFTTKKKPSQVTDVLLTNIMSKNVFSFVSVEGRDKKKSKTANLSEHKHAIMQHTDNIENHFTVYYATNFIQLNHITAFMQTTHN